MPASDDLTVENVKELRNKLQALAVRIHSAQIRVADEYHPKELKLVDFRITSFTKSRNAVNSMMLSCHLMSKYLMKRSWWWENIPGLPDQDMLILVRAWNDSVRIGYIQGLFSCVESSLRGLLRGLDSIACNSGQAEFKSIYECLFRSKLSKKPTDGIELLDLFRMIRNTIHNNGVYFDRQGQNRLLTWKRQQYDFNHGKRIRFLHSDLLLDISDAVQELLLEVVLDSEIRGLSGVLEDPYVDALSDAEKQRVRATAAPRSE